MDDPWFDYFRGRGRLQIIPRNAKGWAATILFIVGIMIPVVAMQWIAASSPVLIVPCLGVILLGVLLFVRWAKAHSQVIDLKEVSRDYAEFQEWKKRNGR